mgnify:CR=1 FL=1
MESLRIGEKDSKETTLVETKTLNTELLTGQTGVRITGLAISEICEDQVSEIKRLVSEYCVGVFPGQTLSPEEQLRFVERLDPLTFTPGEQRHSQWPNLNVVSLSSTSTLPPINGFHTDTSFVPQPPSYTTLFPKLLSSRGGDTVFVNVIKEAVKNTPSFKDVNNIELSFVVIDMLNNSSNEKVPGLFVIIILLSSNLSLKYAFFTFKFGVNGIMTSDT